MIRATTPALTALKEAMQRQKINEKIKILEVRQYYYVP
jgi:hypothetical protein